MNKSAFTLIELIFVIAIIALLSTVAVTTYNRTQLQAKSAKVEADLKDISASIVRLSAHSLQVPNHYSANSCVNNLETYLNTPAAGLLSTDGNFPNWQGPYTELTLLDPWDNYYYFDPDYTCYQEVTGCEDITDGKIVRAIFSFGPDEAGGYTSYDNIVRVLCDP